MEKLCTLRRPICIQQAQSGSSGAVTLSVQRGSFYRGNSGWSSAPPSSVMAAAWRGVVALGLLTHGAAFVQPSCPAALAGTDWARRGARPSAMPVCPNSLRMSEHTEDRCVAPEGGCGSPIAKEFEIGG